MSYRTVIIPPIVTLRSTTLERLMDFAKAGGRIIFLGDCPAYVDALPSSRPLELYRAGLRIGASDAALLPALETERFLDIRREDGQREDRLLHQLRMEENKDLWLFICNGKNPESPDVDPSPLLRFTLNGSYRVILYDTLTGDIRELPALLQDGHTVLHRRWHIHDSILVHLIPLNGQKQHSVFGGHTASSQPDHADASFKHADHIREDQHDRPSNELPPLSGDCDVLLGEVPVALGSPNMLLLDMAEYSFNGGDFYSEEELLRLDNNVRRELGIPIRRKEVVQSYLLEPEDPSDFVLLRFRIPSELPLSGMKLALEEPDSAGICLNGRSVTIAKEGYYVDKDIHTISLPDFIAGENLLEIRVPIGRTTHLEYFYLLGNFGVKINGTRKTLVPPVSSLGWGDITAQDLPFFTGTLTYRMRIRSEGRFTVRVPQYRGGLVKVLVDGKDFGNIAFSPYALDVETNPGEHILELRLYTTRYNGFGQHHHTQGVYFYQSPNSWRSAGDLWSYEYRFRPSGILKSPELTGAVFLDAAGQSCRHARCRAVHITDQS